MREMELGVRKRASFYDLSHLKTKIIWWILDLVVNAHDYLFH